MRIIGRRLRSGLVMLFTAIFAAAVAMLCVLNFIPAAAADTAEQTEPFNGGLESPDGKSLPEEWLFQEKTTVRPDLAEFMEGENSLHVVREDYNSDFYIRSLNRVAVEGDTEYRFSYWIKSVNCDSISGTTASAKIKATIYNAEGQQVMNGTRESGETILNRGSKVSDWTEIYVTKKLPSDAAYAMIEITIAKGKAEFWLDNVTARPNDPVYEDFSAFNSYAKTEGWSNSGAVSFTGGELKLIGAASASVQWDARSSCIYTLSFDYRTTGDSRVKAVVHYYSYAGKVRMSEEFELLSSEETGRYETSFTVTQAAYAALEFVSEGSGNAFVDNVRVRLTYNPRTSGLGWEGAWVCYPASDVAYGMQGQTLYYRYTFELDEAGIASAIIQFTADDTWKFWINGTDITTEENNGEESWSFVSLVDIKDMLVPGKNVFAFEVYNATYYTGVLFDMTVVYQSGAQERFYSDKSVLSQSESSVSAGWEQPDYDDTSWREVYVIGVPPCQPWNEVIYVDNTTITDSIEIRDVRLPDTVAQGGTGEVTFTLSVPETLSADYEFKVYFWGKYSSDSTTSYITSSVLTPVNAAPSSEWKPGEEITATYSFYLPDYVEPGSYMLQLDPDQIIVSGSTSYLDNKLRGHYFRVTKTDIPLTEAEVRREDGKTQLYINGEATAPMLYMRESTNVFKSQYAEGMSDAGVKLICLPNSRSYEMNRSGAVWISDGRYNFAPVDGLVYETLEGAPDAKLMFQLDAEPPQWWKNANPDECAVDSNGNTVSSDGATTYGASYASEKWRTDVGNYFRAFIEHVLEQPYASHMFGVKITAGSTVEWQWWGMTLDTCGDYSPAAENAFRKWLTEKYGTDDALQQAWNDDTVTLATAEVPVRDDRTAKSYTYILDGQTQQNVIDFHLFYSQMTTDSILYFADVVKEASGGCWIVGTYNGYVTNALTYESNNIVNAHISQILSSDDIDFLCAPIAYDTRMPGMSAGYMTMVDSVLDAGKMFFMECDSRTVYFEIEDMDPYLLQEWGKTYTLKDTIELMKRDFATVLAKGCGLWWYDMYGGWFDDPEIYSMVSVMKKEMDYANAHPSGSVAEIAWVIDDDLLTTATYNFGGTYSVLYGANYHQKEQLAHIGAPYDCLYLSEIEAGTARDYKVYLISAVNLDEAEKEALEGLKKDGVTIIWYGIPGIYGEDGSLSAENISEITGIDLALTTETISYNVRIADTVGENSVAAGSEGVLYGDYTLTATAGSSVTPMAYGNDPDAEVLGTLYGTQYAGLLQKTIELTDGGSWTSVYSSVSNIPARVIRNALAASGGHIWTDNDTDALFVGSGYVALNSQYGGERTVSLTEACDVYDVFTGEYVAKNAVSFTIEIGDNETRLFKIVPPGTDLSEPVTPPPSSSDDEGGTGGCNGCGSAAGAVSAAVAAIVAAGIALGRRKRK